MLARSTGPTHTHLVLSLIVPIGTELQLSNTKENHFIMIKSDADVNGCRGTERNQSVTMKCMTSDHRSITWYKNGEVLDLSSEGTMYNQMSGELVIRREDACELLGVYQCFASNDIDTVHVSTRVLPFGKDIPSTIKPVVYVGCNFYECLQFIISCFLNDTLFATCVA